MKEMFIQSGEARLWTVSEGQGITVLLANGGPGCCDYLAPIAQMLRPFARVIRFERRGCGRSTPIGPYDLATCLLDLEAIRTAYGIER